MILPRFLLNKLHKTKLYDNILEIINKIDYER